MTLPTEKLRHFEIKVDVNGSYTVSGGNTEAEAAAGRYETRDDASFDLLDQIFKAISNKIGGNDDSIEVDVEQADDHYWIVGVR